MTRLYQSSRPHHSVLPRPHSDPGLRRKHYGSIQPMDRPEGEPPAWAGIALLIALASLLPFLALFLGD